MQERFGSYCSAEDLEYDSEDDDQLTDSDDGFFNEVSKTSDAHLKMLN
jgi:hypothetical protein